MKEIKIVAKYNIFGALGHQIYTKDKAYKAWQAYPSDDELWIVESDFIVNELPTYTRDFILQHFEMIDERRDRQISTILEKI
jgi:hypothetical protein